MTIENIGEDTTDVSQNSNNSQAGKVFTEQEVNDMMARLKGSLTKKLTKQWEDLGDPEELRNIKQDYERRKLEDQKKRGDFDKILQETVAKKDAEISKRDEIIRNYKIDTPIINAAMKFKAINAEQVKQLVKSSVRLNEEGEVEILDEKGTPRYNDSGRPIGVDDYIQEFLNKNPHFVSATPSTTNGRNNVNGVPKKIDVKTLDFRNPEHRKLYQESRQNKK